MSRASGFASVFALGVVLTLLASPASAAQCRYTNVCNCTVSCDVQCLNGPLAQGGELITCGEWGTCSGGSGCPISSCTACTSTINGTSGGDTLNGNSAHECINGLGGADTISGDAGDDTIHGGDGNDTMYGGSGNDCIEGDAGSDNATGDSGNDLCIAETEASCDR